MTTEPKKVNIVVLGDIGRSPRMQYHALSFAIEGFQVEVIGFPGSDPISQLAYHPHVNIKYMKTTPDFKNYVTAILAYGLKVIWQAVVLFCTLVRSQSCDFLLLQNCPAVPAIAVCYLYSLLFRCKFIIDWHNYAHSIMAMSLHKNHKLVKFAKWIEFYFGQKADGNLCVTRGMKEDLENNYNISAVVHYDRPPADFRKISVTETHELFLRLGKDYSVFVKNCKKDETVFTAIVDGKTVLKDSRPGLVVSSTSWTEDEDFSVLLNALEDYEYICDESDDMPNLLCVITGKGPLKEFYCELIQRRHWEHVYFVTPWLTPPDYPLLIGSADLGVCLHTSSSGLDLPMKVVDMFGCGVPVCAFYFKCIYELVRHEDNSLVFHDTEELSKQISSWFKGFPQLDNPNHSRFRNELAKFNKLRWHDNWVCNVLPLFKS